MLLKTQQKFNSKFSKKLKNLSQLHSTKLGGPVTNRNITTLIIPANLTLPASNNFTIRHSGLGPRAVLNLLFLITCKGPSEYFLLVLLYKSFN